jgi:hypothetical protein
MKVTATATEILDAGYWTEYCRLTSTNEWAINEGQITSDEMLEIPKELVPKFIESNT